ncbi:helix-turn-helix transcriptional regulator [Streptomyces sp. NPDC048248]|uniref:helix-turn-helix transcriptional regulator n=1 Tax=Streptomyces sp. NPDC048248 TaxID=3365523 RepID=UPI00371A8227
MGRREKPLGDCDKPVRQLALWLRAVRQRAGLTYTQLAERTDYHPTTLQRAADGTRVPAAHVVGAYARACNASPDEAERLRRAASAPRIKDAPAEPGGLRIAASNDSLRQAMIRLREQAGQPSLRELERRAGPGRLPRSTLHDILQGRTAPTHDQLAAFLYACGVPARNLPVWTKAWKRAQIVDQPRAARPETAEAEADPADPGWELLRRVVSAQMRQRNPEQVTARFLAVHAGPGSAMLGPR